jgi:ribosomal peptide maturation radical SAM protein 1
MLADRSLRILLVSMPWRETHVANAGLGLLKVVLAEAGHRAEVYDANLVFRVRLGPLYHEVAQYWFSEAVFSPLVWPDYSVARASRLLSRCVTEPFAVEAAQLPERCASILDEVFASIPWHDYDVIGFSATFNQTLASVALAQRVRRAHPEVGLIIGGAACDGPMGAAMMEAFPVFDAAAVGRAETTIAELCERVASGLPIWDCPGAVGRRNDLVVQSPLAAPRANLDELPLPDYDEFFALAKRLGYVISQPAVAMEASLGCWWGEKNLCTFCGLNATSLAFSQKSPARALREIRELSRRYAVDRIEFTDNILPLNYYEELVPELIRLREEEGERYEFFVEIKTNVKREQLEQLKRAGFVFMQPGIESFSDHILRVMKKGNTGISQIQFLKWCAELKMQTTYNIITANPGERVADYEEMAELIPSLVHLPPPGGFTEMHLQRFSPYFDHPELHGIRNVRPSVDHRHIYAGLPEELVSRLTYSFQYDHDDVDSEPLRAARATLRHLVQRWRQIHRPGLLRYRTGAGWLRIDDEREGVWLGTGTRRGVVLRGVHAEIYEYLDQARTVEQVTARFGLTEEGVMAYIEQLVGKRLAHFDGRKVLALALKEITRSTFAPDLVADRSKRVAPPDADLGWTAGAPHPRRSRRKLQVVQPNTCGEG